MLNELEIADLEKEMGADSEAKQRLRINIERMNNGEYYPFNDGMLACVTGHWDVSSIAIWIRLFGLSDVYGEGNTYMLELFGSRDGQDTQPRFFIPTVIVNAGSGYATSLGVKITEGMKRIFDNAYMFCIENPQRRWNEPFTLL